jgi:hypothetical protein
VQRFQPVLQVQLPEQFQPVLQELPEQFLDLKSTSSSRSKREPKREPKR